MCGLVGYAGENSVKLQNAFKFMLFVDQVRGIHSTGVATTNNNNNVVMFKKDVHSTDFLDMRKADNVISSFKHNAIIGHNRAATKGLVNTANAHPFSIKNITLAHNGTLRNQSLLPDYKEFEVDSENICHAIAEIGIEDTVKKLCGAFALTYFDSEDKTLNLVRNHERPLHYCYSLDGQGVPKTLLWASESWMMVVAAQRAGLTISKTEELPVAEMLTLDLSKAYYQDVSKCITRTKLELYTAPVTHVSKRRPSVNFSKEYSFFVNSSYKSQHKGKTTYRSLGSTVCGDFGISIVTADNLDPKKIYAGKVGSHYFQGKDTVLHLTSYWEVEEETPKKSSTGLAKVSH